MLNGARSGRPYKSTIDKIAKAIDDPELIQELYDATGILLRKYGNEKDNCRQWIFSGSLYCSGA